MDEDEIQMWYDDEKQKMLEKYTAELENSKDRDKLQKKFDTAMEKLNKKYYSKMDSAIKKREFSTKIKKRIQTFKEDHNLVKKNDKK